MKFGGKSEVVDVQVLGGYQNLVGTMEEGNVVHLSTYEVCDEDTDFGRKSYIRHLCWIIFVGYAAASQAFVLASRLMHTY